MKVGDKIKDGDGNEWVIGRVWEWPDHNDYELLHKETGERGELRINKHK